jgi:hypothetical protein
MNVCKVCLIEAKPKERTCPQCGRPLTTVRADGSQAAAADPDAGAAADGTGRWLFWVYLAASAMVVGLIGFQILSRAVFERRTAGGGPEEPAVREAQVARMLPIRAAEGADGPSRVESRLRLLEAEWAARARAALEGRTSPDLEFAGVAGRWRITSKGLAPSVGALPLAITDPELIAACDERIGLHYGETVRLEGIIVGDWAAGWSEEAASPGGEWFVSGPWVTMDDGSPGIVPGFRGEAVGRSATSLRTQGAPRLERLPRAWPDDPAAQAKILDSLAVIPPGPIRLGVYPAAVRRRIVAAVEQLRAVWREELAVQWRRERGMIFDLRDVSGFWYFDEPGILVGPPNPASPRPPMLLSRAVLERIWEHAGGASRLGVDRLTEVIIPGFPGRWEVKEEGGFNSPRHLVASLVDSSYPTLKDEMPEESEPEQTTAPPEDTPFNAPPVDTPPATKPEPDPTTEPVGPDPPRREPLGPFRLWTLGNGKSMTGRLVGITYNSVDIEDRRGHVYRQFTMNLIDSDQRVVERTLKKMGRW